MIVSSQLNVNKGIAIALGFFDGMHLGHRKVVSALIKAAKQNDLKTAVITFKQKPSNYFTETKVLSIQTPRDKEMILDKLGVDYLYELDFELFKNMSADDYMKNVLIKYFAPKIIVAGYNHTFGKDKQNTSFLLNNETKYNYQAIIVPQYLYNGNETVSSSKIRKHIEKGHLNATNILLNSNFSITNCVIHGTQIASKLGFPTANINWPEDIVKLPYGVYFGYGICEHTTRPALISWGVMPTVPDEKTEKLEAHLYDFEENIYGKILKIVFVKKHRDQKKFENLYLLKNAIESDYDEFLSWSNNKMN